MAFESVTVEDIATRAATIHTLRRGAGAPLLRLLGYPQTHFSWHQLRVVSINHFTLHSFMLEVKLSTVSSLRQTVPSNLAQIFKLKLPNRFESCKC
jgi:hypothetical protein